MANRFNFTGRRRILESQAKVHVTKDAKPLKVILEQTFSSSSHYKPDDRVMLEAIRRTRRERQELGVIGNLKKDTTVEFAMFADGNEVYYRLSVVDPQTNRLKGMAKRLKDADREQKPTDLDPILPVALSQNEDELGHRFWMVRFTGSEGPTLVISSRKFASYEPVKSAEFRAFVWPEALRQVLTYAYIQCWDGFPSWAGKWKTFAEQMLGEPGAPEAEPQSPDGDYMMKTADWIDAVVRKFAIRFNLAAVTIKNLTRSEDGNV